MTAEEARKNMMKVSTDIIDECNKLIEEASLAGKDFINFPLDNLGAEHNIHKRNLMKYLTCNGFDVSLHDSLDDDFIKTGEHLWIRW